MRAIWISGYGGAKQDRNQCHDCDTTDDGYSESSQDLSFRHELSPGSKETVCVPPSLFLDRTAKCPMSERRKFFNDFFASL